MRIIRRMRTQKAVYFAPEWVDPDTGKQTYKDPVNIMCRWVDKNEFFLARDGSQQVSAAHVYCDRVVELDGVLRKGTVSDLQDETKPDYPETSEGAGDGNNGLWNPLRGDDAWIIRAVNRTPRLRNKNDTDPRTVLIKAIL